MNNTEIVCKYCDETVEDNKFYNIYRMAIATDKQMHYIGLKKLLDELGDYLMQKGYHISAAQTILLRPDILKDFFMIKLENEKPIFWFLQEHEICYDCYKNYSHLVPVR